jgi:hypothetical protein
MTLEFSPRPGIDWLRQLEFSGEFAYITDLNGILMTRDQGAEIEINLEKGDAISAGFSRNLERQDEPFRLAGQVSVPAGVYRSNGWSVDFRPYDGRSISGFAQFSRGDFWGGRRTSLQGNPAIRWSDKFRSEFGYEYERVRLPRGAFTSQVVNTRVDFNPTNRWLTATTLQYSQLDKEWGFNVRLNYIYRTGDDFFVVLNRVLTDTDRSWSLLFKFTRTFEL